MLEDVERYCSTSENNNTKLDKNYDNFQNLQQFADYMKKGFIESKLEKSDWNIAKSAELLGITKEELSQQMAAFGLRQN